MAARVFLAATVLLASLGAYAQDRQVTGKVTDAADGSGLPGVSVQVKGTSKGVATSVDGSYKISVPDGGTLVFSYVGYTSQEVAVGNRTVIDIKLGSDVKALEEVVVVGYGTQKRKEISGTVSSVSSKDFNPGVIANPLQAVQGKVAGLTINQTGSDPNSAPTVRLRGVGSLAAGSDPLYVVDGVPGVPIQNINVNDIETMDVLRDASSAAIYGARAANGVIIITTKRGKGGKSSVEYNGYTGIDVIAKRPDYMNASEYRAAAKSFGYTMDDKGADTDWFGAITRTGKVQSHNIAIGGGTENFSYRASVGYLKQDGVVNKSGNERLSARINLDQKALNGKLDIQTNLSAITTRRDFVNYDAFTYSITNLPTDPIYTTAASNQTAGGIEAGAGYFERPGAFSMYNSVAEINETTNYAKSIEYLGNLRLSYKLTDNLTFAANGALKGSSSSGYYFKSRIPRSNEAAKGLASRGLGPVSGAPSEDKLLELTFNYNKTFGGVNFGALAGYSYQDVTFEGFSATNNNFISDAISFDNLGAGAGLALGQRSNDAVSSFHSNYKLISFFGRLQASISEKYFATVNLRRDGSSKFGANNKWGFFPSASVGWTLSNEDFLKGNSKINNLKLRINYGQAGNSEGIRPYTTLALLGNTKPDNSSYGKYYDNGNWYPVYGPIQNPNPDLKWEVATSYGAGIDFSLFNYRITGTLDYYIKNTNDMLYNVDAPLSINPIYSQILANVASMRNQGLELSINGLIIDKSDFKYDATIALATLKNEVTGLSSGIFAASDQIFLYTGLGAVTRGTSQVPFSIIRPGYPVGAFWAANVTGIIQTQEQLVNYQKLNSNAKLGDYMFEDINKDGKINENDADRTFAGSPLPKVTVSLNNNFSYKNWSLSLFFNGQFGNKIFNAERMLFARQVGRFAEENTLREAATSPIKDDKTGAFNYFVEDGSFVRLNNARLAYTFPKIGVLSRAQIYVSGQNLFVITKFKGVDPEMNTGFATAGVYTKQQFPKSRGFQVGVNLSF
ncbi:MAG: TonB-dependent receptor [Spirosomataceae bacterium]